MIDECQEINEEGRLLNVELRYSIDFISPGEKSTAKGMPCTIYKGTERSLRLVGIVAPTPRRATSTIIQFSIFNNHSPLTSAPQTVCL